MAIKEIIELVLETKKARAEGKSFSESLTKSIVKAQLAVKALEVAWGAVSGQLASAARAAIEYEKTNIRLRAALKTQGFEVEKNAAALNRQAAALENIAGISDETIRSTQALALNMGVSAEQTDGFVRAAIRLSNVTGRTLEGSMQQLVKTTGGLAGELGEAIPQIRALTKEELASGEAIALINELWADNLDLLNQGFSGKVNALSLAWASFGESVFTAADNSEWLNETLGNMTEALRFMSNIINQEGGMSALFATMIPGSGVDLGDVISRSFDVAREGGKPTSAGRRGGPRGRSGPGGAGKGAGVIDFEGEGGFSDAGFGVGFGGGLGSSGVGFLGDIDPNVLAGIQANEEALAAHQENMESIRERQRMIWEDDNGRLVSAHARVQEEITAKELEEQKKRETAQREFRRLAISTATSVGQSLISMGETVSMSMAKTDKDRFEIKKGFAIADAVLSLASGVATTMGAYPFPANAILAGMHAAMAGAQIGVIAGTQYGGGGAVRSVSVPRVGSVAGAAGGPGGFGGGGFGGGSGSGTNSSMFFGGAFHGRATEGRKDSPINITVVGTMSDKDIKHMVSQIDRHIKRT